MTIEEVAQRIGEIGIIPVVRAATVEEARRAVGAICAGGIPIVEITMTVPKAIDVISDMVKQSPHLIVGAGTVLDLETARLTLRGEHGLVVDRGRIVREAVAIILADLDAKGEDSIIVRRFRES